MTAKNIKSEMELQTAETNWSSLYWIAGAGAFIAVAFMLLDIALSFTGGDVETGTWGAVEWFAFFQKDPFVGLRNLGLFNVINTTLSIPLYLALYRLCRRGAPVYAALALIFVLLGAAVYDANNRALAMLSLSSQYAAATSESSRTLLATAGTVILGQAEDFTPGSFAGFFFSSTGSLLMMAAMLRAGIFRRWIALVGLMGTAALLFFTILLTFAPGTFNIVMLIAMLGGLLMVVWHIRVAFGMFGLGRAAWKRAAAPESAVLDMPGSRVQL